MPTPALDPLPPQACWRHTGVREGFETLFVAPVGDTVLLRGAVTGLEDGIGWSLLYDIEVGPGWLTRTARVRLRGRDGEGEVLLERDDADRWSIDGVHHPELDGLRDVDLAGSVVTNTLPLHRFLPGAHPTSAPAVLVGLDLTVARLEQTYAATDEAGVLAYTAPDLGFETRIRVDRAGLVVAYPPLAVRSS